MKYSLGISNRLIVCATACMTCCDASRNSASGSSTAPAYNRSICSRTKGNSPFPPDEQHPPPALDPIASYANAKNAHNALAASRFPNGRKCVGNVRCRTLRWHTFPAAANASRSTLLVTVEPTASSFAPSRFNAIACGSPPVRSGLNPSPNRHLSPHLPGFVRPKALNSNDLPHFLKISRLNVR